MRRPAARHHRAGLFAEGEVRRAGLAQRRARDSACRRGRATTAPSSTRPSPSYRWRKARMSAPTSDPGQVPYPAPIRETVRDEPPARRARATWSSLGYIAGLFGIARRALLQDHRRQVQEARRTSPNRTAAPSTPATTKARRRSSSTMSTSRRRQQKPGAGRCSTAMPRSCAGLHRCRHRQLLRLPDHAGDDDHGAAGHRNAEARQAPAADRGRDLGHRHHHRRRLHRRARRHRNLRARAWP